jgi:hypothetical protein
MATSKHTFPLVLTHPKVGGETTVNSERSLAVMQRRGWRPKPATKKSTKKSAGTSKSTGASGGSSNSDDAT